MKWQLKLSLISLLPCLAHLHTEAHLISTPESQDKTPTNLIPNGRGGPGLWYFGQGPVPPENKLTQDPPRLQRLTQQQIEDDIFAQLQDVTNSSILTSDCQKCVAKLQIMHFAAITQPVDTIKSLAIRSCENLGATPGDSNACTSQYSGVGNQGAYLAQLYAKMSMRTGDLQGFCFYQQKVCNQPKTIAIDESRYFKPKPSSQKPISKPSGKILNALHLTDWHLDSRYVIGSEANCTGYLCCRHGGVNSVLGTGDDNPSVPASRFGYTYCDTPADLAISTFSTMDNFLPKSSVDFTIFTGDVVAHDGYNQVSRDEIEYQEDVTYATFKAHLADSPVYCSLGNHDSVPDSYEAPNSMRPDANIHSWNYNRVARMWHHNHWIDDEAQDYAISHYGAYALTTPHGLKIISLNSDFWYTANIFNYYNMSNPDNSGVLSFLATELQKSEDVNQRAWIIAHVPTGYDYASSLPNPSALFQSIIRRFSPTTIAGVFFGHTHKDQKQIFYDFLPESVISTDAAGNVLRNTSQIDYTKPLQVGYIGASVTPWSNGNAAWQHYAVDSATFLVVNSTVYIANVSEANSWTTPIWKPEYSARNVYASAGGIEWPDEAPLNATFWHGVTEKMLMQGEGSQLVGVYNRFERKSSFTTPPCTSLACVKQKVCFIRSGKASGLC